MRITIAYNLRTDDTEATAELLTEADINRIHKAISSLQHTVTVVEVSGKPNAVIERLLESEPDLIFNLAEGTIGSSREAFIPACMSKWVFRLPEEMPLFFISISINISQNRPVFSWNQCSERRFTDWKRT